MTLQCEIGHAASATPCPNQMVYLIPSPHQNHPIKIHLHPASHLHHNMNLSQPTYSKRFNRKRKKKKVISVCIPTYNLSSLIYQLQISGTWEMNAYVTIWFSYYCMHAVHNLRYEAKEMETWGNGI